MANIAKRPDGRWRARYRDPSGKEHAGHFPRKVDAQKWLDRETAKLQTGTWVEPKSSKITVAEWCQTWLAGYGTRKHSTVRGSPRQDHGSVRVASARLPATLGHQVMTVQLQVEHADSYVYALHARLAQIHSDAVHDGVLARSPASRRTSPRTGSQRPYVASTEQIWGLHDAMGERYRAGLLLAAFAGLRLAEVCGLKVADIDFMRGVVSPVRQHPDDALKTECSRTPIPIPDSLALTLSVHVAVYSDYWLLADEWGHQLGPWQLQRAFRAARAKVPGLPVGFRFHDLRHYYASLLIASGLDVKVVQTRLRHASAKTTLDTYGHLWPDSDDSTRAAIDAVMTARSGNSADFLRTEAGAGKHFP